MRLALFHLLVLAAALGVVAGCTTPVHRCSLWLDVYEGEPIAYADLLDDLAGVRVVYLGERHTIDRHHALQLQIVNDLIARGHPLVLALEQMEAQYQPTLDEYNRGALSFADLAQRTDWAKRWSNYEDYRPIIEAAHAAGAPILALNAKAETVRQVGRQGLDALPPELRAELPADFNLDDPMYAQHLAQIMMVHATMPAEMMRTAFEAQVARDEMMADRLCAFLASDAGRERGAVVLCGSGHVQQRMGFPSRVQRRMPDVTDRIVIFSASGDVEITPQMRKTMRDITITHEQMRILDRPIADYLHVTSPRPEQPAR